MSATVSEPVLERTLVHEIVRRTHRRVRNLTVEFREGVVILRGETSSFHVKQLALHAVREIMPFSPVRNGIRVES